MSDNKPSRSPPVDQDPSAATPTIGGGGGQGVFPTTTGTASSSGSSTPINYDDTTLRSPSPRKPSNINFLGLGVPSQTSSGSAGSSATPAPAPTPSLTVTTYPHLAHYIFGLLQNVNMSPTKPTTSSSTGQHPLSVSSSGESDEDDSPSPPLTTFTSFTDDINPTLQTPKKQTTSRSETVGGISGAERDSLVKKIVELLDNEEEEKVKDVLKPFMGDLAKDEILMDQVCLDCMHRRKDDVEQVPYAPHFTPSRARGSPNPAVAHPLRPFTPTRVPSFRNRTPLGRPHSPSPALAQPAPPTVPSNPAASASSSGHSASSGSPVISPRMLNAKAATFSPTARVASAGSSTGGAGSASTPFLPSDPWKDIASDNPPRSASPFGAIGPTSMSRTNSSIAIAAPLFSDRSSPFHSPMGTPNRTTIKMPDVFNSPSGANTPTFSRTSSYKGVIPDDDDDDEFSPFGKGLPKLHHQDPSSYLNTEAKPFLPFGSSSGLNTAYSNDGYSESSFDSSMGPQGEMTDEEFAGSGMTPLDVLCSVFTSVPRSELEDALHRSGYDFESAMGYLVSQHTHHTRSGASTPQRVSSPRPLLGVGNRGGVGSVMGHHAPERGYFQQGGRSFRGDMSPGFVGGTRSPGGNAGKMCRYFLAGECRRSDCRFSHDIDRALCRFWLRGHCAKGPNCEFLHQLPNNLDPNALSSAMSHVEISSDGYAQQSSYTPADEFPDLLSAKIGRGARFDPSRNRFANAVKRATPGPAPTFQVSGMRQSPLLAHGQVSSPNISPSLSVALPKPSSRIKLRPPALLPTLKTGSATNEQYMSTRSTAIRLGHARNACLARAADAFRRGDGAAAKRFSREGKALNQRMLNESSEAAQVLVRERRKEAQLAIRERDPSWSDDPTDRSERGKECAGGLGVIMGTAPRSVLGGELLSSAERVEALLDLHTLHGGEGQEITGQFLAELDRENFRGLAYIVIGEEKHVGSQDPLRGASKVRLGTSIKQVLGEWGYAWNENAGVICVDPCRF